MKRTNTTAKALLSASMLASLLMGCSAEVESVAPADEPNPHAHLYDCEEVDFGEVHTLSGPGYDADTGLTGDPQDKYFVTSTMLYWKEGLQQDFYAMGGRVMAEMDASEGLIAWALGTDETCRAARSISVWRSEEAMYKFVVSGAHGEAVTHISELSSTGKAARWEVGPDDIGALHWDTAREKLLEVEESHVYD
jgi:heme-degrading monooxygenase HmoA